MNSLKKIYNLSYDVSGFNSGLVNWYNQLIDKSQDDLSVSDVCKMIRQDILKDVAVQKAIELFLDNPYDGEYDDGGLLKVLTSLDIKSIPVATLDKLKATLGVVRHEYIDFDWFDEEAKFQYTKNVEKMLETLTS